MHTHTHAQHSFKHTYAHRESPPAIAFPRGTLSLKEGRPLLWLSSFSMASDEMPHTQVNYRDQQSPNYHFPFP